jgi:hypothetical protein
MNAKVLFYLFVSIFAITAIITLLGITKVINIEHEFLNKLFYGLIIEVVASIVNLFTLQFLTNRNKVRFRFDIGEPYDKNSVETFKCTAKLRDENGKETSLKCNLYHDDIVGLCSNVEIANYKQTFSVIFDIQGKKFQGSEWLETKTIKLQRIN